MYLIIEHLTISEFPLQAKWNVQNSSRNIFPVNTHIERVTCLRTACVPWQTSRVLASRTVVIAAFEVLSVFCCCTEFVRFIYRRKKERN